VAGAARGAAVAVTVMLGELAIGAVVDATGSRWCGPPDAAAVVAIGVVRELGAALGAAAAMVQLELAIHAPMEASPCHLLDSRGGAVPAAVGRSSIRLVECRAMLEQCERLEPAGAPCIGVR
jgi:hypothetical protein